MFVLFFRIPNSRIFCGLGWRWELHGPARRLSCNLVARSFRLVERKIRVLLLASADVVLQPRSVAELAGYGDLQHLGTAPKSLVDLL
jgi:hypothetical protein